MSSPSRFSLRPTALAAAFVLQTAAGAALAQAAASEGTLSTVTVSADASAEGLSKPVAGGQVARGARIGVLGAQDTMETPFSFTAYTNEVIQDQQARSIGDVLQNDPSVRLSRGYGNYQQLYVVRGFPLYSDDIAYNGLYGLVPRQYMLTEFIERVELLRGANSLINGAAPGGSGIGGSVNLVPKRAPREPVSQVTVGVNSEGQGLLATDIARRFGPDGATGVRLNAITSSGNTGVDREDSRTSGLSLGLDWRSSNVRLSADVGYQDRRLDQPRPSVQTGTGLPVPAAPDSRTNYAQPWTESNSKDAFATVRGEVDFSPAWTGWAAIGVREGKERNVLTDPITTTSAAGATTQFRFDNARKDTVATGEVGLRGKFATGAVDHTVSASASRFDLKSKNAYEFSDSFASSIYNPTFVPAPGYSAFSTAGGSLDNPLVTARQRQSSFVLADTMGFLRDTVLLTLGARHQTIKQQNYDYTGPATTSNDDSRTTPLAAIVFKATDNLSFYANYAEALVKGDNAPAFSFNPFFAVANANAALPTYVSRQKEAGLKYDANGLVAGLSFFTTTQPLAYIDPATQTYGRYGEQRNRGIEFTLAGEPVKGLRVLGGLTLLDAEQRATAGGTNNGRDAIGAPGHQFNLGAEWDVPGLRGLALNARVVNTSSQYADAANTQKLPSWTRLDVGARYVTEVGGRLTTLRARIDNLADKNYWASAGGYPGQGYLVQGAPRTLMLTATVDF